MRILKPVAAEFLGSGLLATTVIGSGIAAQRLSPGDTGLQLLENAIATGLGLGVLILLFLPVSGAHFNPVVSLADWMLGRRPLRDLALYLPAQVVGCIGGAVLANLMFGLPAVSVAATDRLNPGTFLAEVVATAGLVFVIFTLVRLERPAAIPVAVGAYIGAAYFFTSSTAFANPAITVGRIFSDSFAGIAPQSVPGFLAAQFIGAVIAVLLVWAFYPRPARRVAAD